MNKWSSRILLAVAAWTVIGALFALPYVLRGGGYNSLYAIVLNWWLWGLAAPVILVFDRRLSNAKRPLAQSVVIHLLFGLLVTAIYVGVAATLEYKLGLNDWNPSSQPVALLDWFLWGFLVYCVILAALQAQKYYRRHSLDELRLERLERRFAEARLSALRAQIDPHFLFNALNGISSQVEREPKTARKMIEHLSDLLRRSFDSGHRQEAPLVEEVDFLNHYVAIQKMRFTNRLTVELSIAPEVRQALVPSLLLQPLVENAIRHGIAGRDAGGRVWVSAERAGDMVEIHVIDDGAGLPEDWDIEASTGLGLLATRERILTLYPENKGRIEVKRRVGGGTEVEIALPLRMAGGGQDEPAVA